MSSHLDLARSTAIVTGASSGLGRASAEALIERGAHVVGIDLNPLANVAWECRNVDVSDRRQVIDAVATVGSAARPLRVVVNCAGLAPARRMLGRNGIHDYATFRRCLEVNLAGTFYVVSATAARMLEQAHDGPSRGAIVNTASVAAFEGQIGQVAYACSKAGVVGLTARADKVLAPHGIRVNAIAPGVFDTAMAASASPTVLERLVAGIPHPSRLGRPAEYAALALTLVESAGIGGQTVRLDGALRLAER